MRRVSGQPFWQFARSRLFEPLGMRDSSYLFSPEWRPRRFHRTPGLPATGPLPGMPGGCDSPEYDELDLGNNGVTSTARDLAVFLQMLLKSGSYGDRRILSPASVAAMTRPQVDYSIPLVLTVLQPTGKRLDFEGKIAGGYGYGLFLFTGGSRFVTHGSLISPSGFGHTGYHGTYMWTDPEYGLVGHDKPTILLTNESHASARQLLTRYARRMLIENALADAVRFFHIDALSSSVGFKVDFDMALLVLASGLYRTLAKRMRGYHDAQARQIFRDLINMPATVEISSSHVVVHFRRCRQSPTAQPFLENTVTVPWWNNLPLHFVQ